MKHAIKSSKDASGRITGAFSYNSAYVEKVKTIPGHRWHPQEKHRSFPDSELEQILKIFKDEEVDLGPVLKEEIPKPVITGPGLLKQSLHNFEDLRRELVSRKYSYKTVKGYIYYKGIGGSQGILEKI